MEALTTASVLLYEKLEAWIIAAITILPNFLIAVAIVIIFAFIAKFARSAMEKLIHRVRGQKVLENFFGTIIFILVLGVGLFIALGILGLEKTVTSLLAGAGIIGLALGFAFQDIASNFIAGIILSLRRPFHVGEMIETNSIFGKVSKIDLRTTHLITPTGELVMVPNKDVFETPLKNYSIRGWRRVDLEVGVSYDDDLKKAQALTLGAVKDLNQKEGAEPEFFYTGFGDSSINFVVRFWVKYNSQPDYLGPRSEAIKAIKKSFDDNGISIPFPIRTLDIPAASLDALSGKK